MLQGHVALATLRFPKGVAGPHLDAFARRVRDGLDARLILVGEPFREHGRDYAETLRDLVARSGAADRWNHTVVRPSATSRSSA